MLRICCGLCVPLVTYCNVFFLLSHPTIANLHFSFASLAFVQKVTNTNFGVRGLREPETRRFVHMSVPAPASAHQPALTSACFVYLTGQPQPCFTSTNFTNHDCDTT